MATRFPHLDVALLPVGGEGALGFAREMGPADAARAAALPGPPERLIPIGYGKRGGFPLRWFARHPTERLLEELPCWADRLRSQAKEVSGNQIARWQRQSGALGRLSYPSAGRRG